MNQTLIYFHNRSILADKEGRVTHAEALLRIPRVLMFVFSISLAVLGTTTVYGYGRTIWSHGAYYAVSVSRSVLLQYVDASNASHRARKPNPPKPTRLPLSPDAQSNPRAGMSAGMPTEAHGALVVEKLSIEAPIVNSTPDARSVNAALEKGVLLWPGSATLGAGGTTIILGHSSAPLSYRGKYGAVFSLLGKLQAGDVVSIEAADATFRYRVRDRLIINPKKQKPDLLKQDGETLLLVSCWPVGTNWQRVVVRAERVL